MTWTTQPIRLSIFDKRRQIWQLTAQEYSQILCGRISVGTHGELVLIVNGEKPYGEIAIATYAPGVWKAIFVAPIKSDKEE